METGAKDIQVLVVTGSSGCVRDADSGSGGGTYGGGGGDGRDIDGDGRIFRW